MFVFNSHIFVYLSDIVEGKNIFAEKELESPTSRPFGYWTKNEGENMRLFLDKFAKSRNLDPRNPKDWYSVKGYDIILAGYVFLFLFSTLFFLLLLLLPSRSEGECN